MNATSWEVGRCCDCRWWSPYEATRKESDQGECTAAKASETLDGVRMRIALTDGQQTPDGIDAWLVTASDFWCVQFEAKTV